MDTNLPTGTVTFLFTDIEGSTKLWQQFSNTMPDALACHNAILRKAIEAHSGHLPFFEQPDLFLGTLESFLT
jgi:class 3 adenylate cyclase